LRRFYRLDRATQSLIFEALALSAFIAVAFRMVGVPQTQAWLRRWSGVWLKSAPHRISGEQIPAFILSARRAQNRVKRATGLGGMCLARSLTLWTLLRRRGIETDLRVGYRKGDGKIEGHAWLEYEGTPVNDKPEVTGTYTVTAGAFAFDNWRQVKT
jgi:hypothetical protein